MAVEKGDALETLVSNLEARCIPLAEWWGQDQASTSMESPIESNQGEVREGQAHQP
jgi:hypothetical protein